MHGNRRLTLFLAACAVVFAAYWFTSDRASAVLYDGLGAIAGLALIAGGRAREPGARTPWYLLGAGTLLWAGGDAAWSVYEYLGHPAQYPSVADLAYLLAYPLWVVGILIFARGGGKRPDVTIAIDALIATFAGGIITWLVIVRPQIAGLHAPIQAVGVTIAYPIMDVLLLGAAVGALLTPRRHDRAFALLITGLVATLVADNAYSIAVLDGTYTQHSWMNAGWLIFYTAWGSAAFVRPRLANVGDDAATGAARPRNWVSLVSFSVAATTFPVVYLAVAFNDDHVGMLLAFAASVPVIVLIAARMWITMRRGEHDRRRIERQRELLERALEDLRAVQAERSELLDRTVRAAEEERVRVAVELHDGPIQHLAAVSLRLGLARSKLKVADVDATDHVLELAECELRDDIAELRRLMSDLRPPALDEGGLEGALRDHCDVVAGRTSTAVRLRYGPSIAVAHDTEIVLYRIAQEALSNVARHAHASSIDVRVEATDDGVVLAVHDDGGGFDAGNADAFTRDGHFGLAGMAQRASMVGGRLSVESARGAGTTVRAWVPWPSA